MEGLDNYLRAIPQSRLNKPLTDRTRLCKIARRINNWRVLALPNVDNNDIENIGRDWHTNEEQKIALLDTWTKKNGHLATYHQLAECLYNAGDISTLEVLCRELGATFTTSTPPQTHETHPSTHSPEERQAKTKGRTCSRHYVVVAVCVPLLATILGVFYTQSEGVRNLWPPAVYSSHGVRSTSTTNIPKSPPGNDPKWMDMEPEIKLLTLIKYTDSEGKEQKFNLISKIQNDCKRLGTVLDIDEETLTAYLNKNKPQSEICSDILHKWLQRGEGDYEVTWAGLLKAMNDAELGGVEKQLRKALTLHFK